MSKFEDFRSEYGSFVFKDYSIEKEDGVYKVYLYYSIPRLRDFKTRWEFPAAARDIAENDPILKSWCSILVWLRRSATINVCVPKLLRSNAEV